MPVDEEIADAVQRERDAETFEPAAPDEIGLERFQRRPILDRIDPRQLELIQKTIAPRCTNAEIGHFLELCAHYGLDPFAREAWCAKDKNSDRLLIMVGRDGLRKIAQRNGLHVDGDVVRKNDMFAMVRSADGNRTITHSYGSPSERGEIIGAWAECREGGPLGRPMGYFYAPLEEYLPKNVSQYSPWSKQLGVMILAAAERQAIRQGTPLGGLLAEGEDDVVNERHQLEVATKEGPAPQVLDAEPSVLAGEGDIAVLWNCSEGLPFATIKQCFAAEGLDIPTETTACFDNVPQASVGALALTLKSAPRQSSEPNE